MDASERAARQRLSVLELAVQLGNAAEACRRRGMEGQAGLVHHHPEDPQRPRSRHALRSLAGAGGPPHAFGAGGDRLRGATVGRVSLRLHRGGRSHATRKRLFDMRDLDQWIDSLKAGVASTNDDIPRKLA